MTDYNKLGAFGVTTQLEQGHINEKYMQSSCHEMLPKDFVQFILDYMGSYIWANLNQCELGIKHSIAGEVYKKSLASVQQLGILKNLVEELR